MCIRDRSRAVLIGEKIFNENELFCRLEVELEKFTKKVQIESRVLGDLAINHIVPTAVIYPVSYTHLDVYKRQVLTPPSALQAAHEFQKFSYRTSPSAW